MLLKKLGNPVDTAYGQDAGRSVGILAGTIFGGMVAMIAPVSVVANDGPVWIGALLAAVILLAAAILTRIAMRRVGAKPRSLPQIEPPRLWERLVANRIDICLVDGRIHSLPLHAADLKLEGFSGGMMPVDQYMLTATGQDGQRVRVIITHTWRGLVSTVLRQDDAVLWAIAAVAEQSAYPAGQEVAAQLRWFIGQGETQFLR